MGRRTGKGVYNHAPNVDKKARALELRAKGWAYRDIAEDLGVSHQTAHNWVTQEMKRIITPPAEEAVKMELVRYDRLLKRLEERLESGEDPGRLGPTILRISKARRELLGLDMPVRVEAQVVETTQEDLALQEMIREAKVKASLLQSEQQSQIEAEKE